MEKRMLLLAMAMAETIREAGEVPSGHLYAAMMARCSLSEYQALLGSLKHAGLVKESGFLLTWAGKVLH